jgi:hypothetical protein
MIQPRLARREDSSQKLYVFVRGIVITVRLEAVKAVFTREAGCLIDLLVTECIVRLRFCVFIRKCGRISFWSENLFFWPYLGDGDLAVVDLFDDIVRSGRNEFSDTVSEAVAPGS